MIGAVSDSKSPAVSVLEAKIQKALTDSYRSALFKHYPADVDEKNVSALLCVRAASTGDIGLFQIRGTVLAPVKDFALVGWDESLYKLAAQRMYRDDLSITQAILAGLQVIGLAKKTSQYVGGATSVVVASDNGKWLEQPQAVEANEDTIARVRDVAKTSMPEDFEDLFPSQLKGAIGDEWEIRFATQDGFWTLRLSKDGGVEVLDVTGKVVTAMAPSE